MRFCIVSLEVLSEKKVFGRSLHDCKDDVGLVSDVLEGHGRDHDNQEVEDPIT